MYDGNNVIITEKSRINNLNWRGKIYGRHNQEVYRRDIPVMMDIWNAVVDEGEAFSAGGYASANQGAKSFFGLQSYCGVAEDDGKLVGLYICIRNNVGRCAHIANASMR